MDETVNRTQPAPAPPGQDVPKRRPPRRWGRALLLILLVAAVGYVVFERAHNIPRVGGRGGFRTPPQSVRTAAATSGEMPIVLNALGAVTPLDTVTVQTQIAGQLQKIGFAEGQVVKAGAFLAQIDPRPYQAALEQAQATLQKDTAALAQARSDLVRYQRLAKQDSIAQQQVQDQEFLVQQDIAALAVDQANVDTAKLNLSYCRIVSPITGLAGLLQTYAGNYLQPSASTPIVVITQLEPISVIFAIPQQDLPQVWARMKGGAKLPVSAYDQTNTHLLDTGVLMATDSSISTSTGTINLKASFPNATDILFPNQFVNVRLLVNTLTGVTLVPNPAIQRGAPGTFVYLVNPNHTVSVQKVQIGPSDANDTVVTSGLSPGQNVVIDGADRLTQGAKVVVRNGNPVASPGTAAAAPPSGAQGPKSGGRGGHRPNASGANGGGAQ